MKKELRYYPILDITRTKAQELQAEIRAQHYPFIVEKPGDATTFLVGGGDWFMLDTIKKRYKPITEAKKSPFFLGINCGNLWFLLNTIKKVEDIPRFEKDISIIKIQFMKVTIVTATETFVRYAINDVVIWNSIIDYFTVTVEMEKERIAITGTGLLVTTPLWSTAYWLGNGGPLMPLDTSLWGIMGLSTKPFGYKLIEKQKITITATGRMPISCIVDGYNGKVDAVTHITIEPTEYTAKLWFTDNFEKKRILLTEKKMS